MDMFISEMRSGPKIFMLSFLNQLEQVAYAGAYQGQN